MPAPHVQKFFRTYNQEYQYTLNIIKQVQEASRDHPGLFTSVVSILNAAMANKDRGLVAILPELLELLHDAGLHGIAVQCVEYARFVSDVTPDGQSGVEEEGEGVDDHSSDYCDDDDDDDEEEEDGDEDDGDDGDDGEEARTRNSPTPLPVVLQKSRPTAPTQAPKRQTQAKIPSVKNSPSQKLNLRR